MLSSVWLGPTRRTGSCDDVDTRPVLRLDPDQSLYMGCQKASHKDQMEVKVSTTGVVIRLVRSGRRPALGVR